MIKDGDWEKCGPEELRSAGYKPSGPEPAHPGRLRLTCTPKRGMPRPPPGARRPPRPPKAGRPMASSSRTMTCGGAIWTTSARGPVGDRCHGHRHDRRDHARLPVAVAAWPRHELRQHLPQHAADRAARRAGVLGLAFILGLSFRRRLRPQRLLVGWRCFLYHAAFICECAALGHQHRVRANGGRLTFSSRSRRS